MNFDFLISKSPILYKTYFVLVKIDAQDKRVYQNGKQDLEKIKKEFKKICF